AVGVAGLAILTSGLVFQQKVIGREPGQICWNQSWADQKRLGNALNGLGIAADTVIMVNNPPGFFLTTGRPAVVIPYGNEEDMIRAARKYQAKYVLLDENHVAAADALYDSPRSAQQLRYVMTIDGTHLFEVDGE
ncbi:MAG TPA: hypothetical protein VHO48_13510, partial [Anaerolineaceae bacterium]|nr:hypothetical protein [Anaerolineaceae bacterium]